MQKLDQTPNVEEELKNSLKRVVIQIVHNFL